MSLKLCWLLHKWYSSGTGLNRMQIVHSSDGPRCLSIMVG